MIDINAILTTARKETALIDLHLVDGPPVARIGGRLRRLELSWNTEAILAQFERELTDDERARLMGRGNVSVRMIGSFGLVRAHFYRDRGRTALALRFLDEESQAFDSLDLPAVIDSPDAP